MPYKDLQKRREYKRNWEKQKRKPPVYPEIKIRNHE